MFMAGSKSIESISANVELLLQTSLFTSSWTGETQVEQAGWMALKGVETRAQDETQTIGWFE